MSIISESLTIGLLLSLVFGALFFYIYSRLSYVEKRISLMENILLDIKVTQEQMPTHILPEVPPNTRFQQVTFQPELEPYQPFQPDNTEAQELPELVQTNEPFVPELEEVKEDYTAVLEEAHRETPFEPSTSEDLVNSGSKVTVNYEAMTKDELLEIAKEKGLRYGRAPGRDKLLQLIRKSEELGGESLQAVELEA